MKRELNKYQVWYDQLIERARSRVITGYYEKHHIVPKSLRGANDESNLVKLTAREHVVAHMLLPRFVEEPSKMWYALWCMVNTNGVMVNSRLYEQARVEAFSRRRKDVKWKVNNAAGAKRRACSESWKQNHTRSMRQRAKTKDWAQKIKQHWIEIYKRPEYRANRLIGMMLRNKRKGKKLNDYRWYKPKPYNIPREGLMAIIANEKKYGSAKADIALALLSY